MSDNPIPSLENLLAHRRWVQGVARRLLRDEHAAEDLAQETWMRAMRSPPDPERDPKPWLRRVLKNLAANVRRGEGRRRKRETAWRAPREQRSPEALVAEAEQHKRLVSLLLDLEDPFKTALVLRFYEGLGPQEIAAQLGIPVGTVHSRIARAIERLKTRLDEQEHGDRRAWIAAFLPLAGFDRAAPAAAATATTTSIAGILAMTLTKPKVALLTVLLVGCLIGGGLWLASDTRGDDPAGGATPDLLASDPAPELKGRGAPLTADADPDAASRREATSDPVADAARIVRGTVRDAAGDPVEGAEVFVLPAGAPGLDDKELADPRYGRTLAKADGTFAVRMADATSARLLAFAPGHMAASVVLADAPTQEVVEIGLGEPWRLRVQVADADDVWPADCKAALHSRAIDTLDRAVDPRRQYLDIELAAPGIGNTHEVALHRTGSVWLFIWPPRGMAATPPMLEIAQPTEEVSIRLVRSAELTVNLLDASTGHPIDAGVNISGWMGHRDVGHTAWSFGSRGPRHTQRSWIAPGTYDLEFDVPGYEPWKERITIQAEGEARTLDIRLAPQRRGIAAGRLVLEVTAGGTSPKALLELARLRHERLADHYEIQARMRAGDLEAWNRVWGSSGGWADLHQTPREDGSIEVQQALYPLQDRHMPAGTYDVYVAERGTGRAAFRANVRVFGDRENRYGVRVEPGTMFRVTDVLPGDAVFTNLEVRTEEAGRLPILALTWDSTMTYQTPLQLDYLLRVPRKPLRIGPFPGASVEVRAVDAEGQTRSTTVRGAGRIDR